MTDQPTKVPSSDDKRKLLAKLLSKAKGKETQETLEKPTVSGGRAAVSLKEGIKELKKSLGLLKIVGQDDPFFRVFDGMMKPVMAHDGRDIINFSGYDYLGFASDPRVHAEVIKAVQTMGTSVGASRIASGERPLHRDLEKELAELFGVEDAIAFVSGYGTNQGVLSHIIGPKDLVVHDAYMHRSAIDGCIASGAMRLAFAHNNCDALEEILIQQRKNYRQCVIIVEGIYSMDGDLPDLVRLVALKKKYNCLLFVDEAHSLGVLGQNGRGIAEHCGVPPRDVDFWMGTLSKSLASCGGVIAGNRDMIQYLRYTAPGFVYSVGMTPANVAAALTALRLLCKEPERAARARDNGRYFFNLLVENGLDTGLSAGYNVTPLIVGNTKKTVQLSNALLEKGINTQAIFYPAVEEEQARLRFFITAEHTRDQLDQAVETIVRLYKKICG